MKPGDSRRILIFAEATAQSKGGGGGRNKILVGRFGPYLPEVTYRESPFRLLHLSAQVVGAKREELRFATRVSSSRRRSVRNSANPFSKIPYYRAFSRAFRIPGRICARARVHECAMHIAVHTPRTSIPTHPLAMLVNAQGDDAATLS